MEDEGTNRMGQEENCNYSLYATRRTETISKNKGNAYQIKSGAIRWEHWTEMTLRRVCVLAGGKEVTNSTPTSNSIMQTVSPLWGKKWGIIQKNMWALQHVVSWCLNNPRPKPHFKGRRWVKITEEKGGFFNWVEREPNA